jgi:hypothetical protein
MLRQNNPRAFCRFTSLLTVLLLALLGVLLVSFPALSNVDLSWLAHQRDQASAQSQAHSGLEYLRELIISFIAEQASQVNRDIAVTYVEGDTFADFEGFLRQHLEGSGLSHQTSLSEAITFKEGQRRGRYLLLHTIDKAPAGEAYQIIEIKQYDDDQHSLMIVSTGIMGKVTVHEQANYTIVMNPPPVMYRR